MGLGFKWWGRDGPCNLMNALKNSEDGHGESRETSACKWPIEKGSDGVCVCAGQCVTVLSISPERERETDRETERDRERGRTCCCTGPHSWTENTQLISICPLVSMYIDLTRRNRHRFFTGV